MNYISSFRFIGYPFFRPAGSKYRQGRTKRGLLSGRQEVLCHIGYRDITRRSRWRRLNGWNGPDGLLVWPFSLVVHSGRRYWLSGFRFVFCSSTTGLRLANHNSVSGRKIRLQNRKSFHVGLRYRNLYISDSPVSCGGSFIEGYRSNKRLGYNANFLIGHPCFHISRRSEKLQQNRRI